MPQNCGQCRGDENLRAQWGCDEPSKVLFLEHECVSCSGAGCRDCKTTGVWRLDRCPYAVVPDEVWRVIEYSSLIEAGILPISGGLEEQSHTFLAALRIAITEKAEHDQRDLKRGR